MVLSLRNNLLLMGSLQLRSGTISVMSLSREVLSTMTAIDACEGAYGKEVFSDAYIPTAVHISTALYLPT